jgi:3-hydroxybutyryl-CoA dehydrogenase
MSQAVSNRIQTVTVIGAGTMGNGICHVFAQSGFDVRMMDVKQDALDKALATIGKNLDRQLAKQAIQESDKTATLARIKPCTDMATALDGTDLVVEAATENIDLKMKIF